MKWATDNINSSVVSGSVLESRLNAVLPATQEVDVTLVRTILCLRILPTDTTVGNPANAMLVGLGVGVTGEEAFVAGGGAIPSPSVAGEQPTQGWVFQCMYWIPENTGSSSGLPLTLVEMDLRAQRKVGSGAVFLKFVNSPGAGVAFSVRVVGIVRTLYKLP